LFPEINSSTSFDGAKNTTRDILCDTITLSVRTVLFIDAEFVPTPLKRITLWRVVAMTVKESLFASGESPPCPRLASAAMAKNDHR